MSYDRVINYLKEKSVFKFEIIMDETLLNVLDDIAFIMIVKKQNNYLYKTNPLPMISIVFKNKSSFLRYLKVTEFYEITKLGKLKFLNAFRVYCQHHHMIEDYYHDSMLISISNLQQQIQGLILDENKTFVEEIIKETLLTRDVEIKMEDTPFILIVVPDEYELKHSYMTLVKENINHFIKEKIIEITDSFDDILQIDIKHKKDDEPK